MAEQAAVDLPALAKALRRRQTWSHRGALLVSIVGALAGVGLVLEGADLARRDSFLRHTSGPTLILIGLLVYTVCAFAATWVYYSFDPRLRLRRFPIVFVAGIGPFLLAAFLGQLLAGLAAPAHGGGHTGGSVAPGPRRRRAKGPGLAAAVLDSDDASRVLGGAASAPVNSDTWWMPRVSIGSCESANGGSRVYLLVCPRERAPRWVLRRAVGPRSVERRSGQIAVTAAEGQWVVRATVRSNTHTNTAEAELSALAQHSLERLQGA